jgi:lysophospholipase L1-like esterase
LWVPPRSASLRGDDPGGDVRSKLLFAGAVAGITAALVETAAFVASSALGDLFDDRERVIATLNAEGLRAFASDHGDPELGWSRRGPARVEDRDCRGNPVVYTFDAAGGRSYAGYDAAHARVIAVGDSYTAGAETSDDAAYPARLAARLGVAVANYGIGAYDPLQATLLLERQRALHPEADVAVLGIMYENLFRLVNGYRPVLYDDAMPYALKPHMAGGVAVAFPGPAALEDFDTFLAHASAAFDADFWARPRRAFPYAIAVLRGIASNTFLFRELQSNLRNAGIPEYALAFRAERFARELVGVLVRFDTAARERGLHPVAIFLPRNRFDTQSASAFLEAHRADLPADLLVADAGTAPIDWSRYNLEVSDGDDLDICHPSAYGYDALAEFVASEMRAAGIVPP